MRRLIIFLIRKYLGLKKFQAFRFGNQNSDVNYYYFTESHLMKYSSELHRSVAANVSLNYLLSNYCQTTLIREECM